MPDVDISFAIGGDIRTDHILDEIVNTLRDIRDSIGSKIRTAFVGTPDADGKGGGKSSVGFFGSLLGGLSGVGGILGGVMKGFAVFGLALAGVKLAFQMLKKALELFADVNATIAVAYERLLLFVRGVLVVMAEVLAPVLDELAEISKGIRTILLNLFVDLFTLIRPTLLSFLSVIKEIIQNMNMFFGIKALDIEEQGLRRSATGVANVLEQFAATAENPQMAPDVNINIGEGEFDDLDMLLEETVATGRAMLEESSILHGRPQSIFQGGGPGGLGPFAGIEDQLMGDG